MSENVTGEVAFHLCGMKANKPNPGQEVLRLYKLSLLCQCHVTNNGALPDICDEKLKSVLQT